MYKHHNGKLTSSSLSSATGVEFFLNLASGCDVFSDPAWLRCSWLGIPSIKSVVVPLGKIIRKSVLHKKKTQSYYVKYTRQSRGRNEQTREQAKLRANEWTSKRVNERTNKRTNERANKRTNEPAIDWSYKTCWTNAVTYHFAGNFPFPSSKSHAIKCNPRRFFPSCHAWSRDIEWLRYSRELALPLSQVSPKKHQTHYNTSHSFTESEIRVVILNGFHMPVKIPHWATTS